ncbi:PKD domain-containing protein [Parasediminibacterium sp. JCM 36343]|uniref:PKD domain-containing protein n=1 Tax=Parasediminibacterium sp. JCM 36343 TaxID=3374279 RepID=UPI0039784F7B
MKIAIPYFFLIFLVLAGLLNSCTKGVDAAATTDSTSTPTTIPTVPVVGGVTSAYIDTVVSTVGNVTIKYSRTSQCYPSNEIFAFSATATGLPTSAIFNWDFGDGHTINGATSTTTVANIYQTAGNYTVTLKITDVSKNLISTVTVNVKTHGQQVTPHASFYAQIFDVNYLNNYNFNANGSTVPRGTISNFAWIWGDGTTTSAATPDNTPHNFPFVAKDTTYPVKLVVTSSEGCKDTATVPVNIAAVYNIAGGFDTTHYDVCTAEYILFKSNATGVPDGAVYTWDFADASGTATGNPIKHSYTYQNEYAVKMTISLNGKILYVTSSPVHANGQNIRPKALFLKNVSFEDGTSVKWAFYSQANIAHGYFTGYTWNLDNGTIDTNFNTYIDYTYQKGTMPVTHPIKFIVTGNSGCSDTAISYITIPAK